MASSDEDVGQLLGSKAAIPIAQLTPDLPDQPTRKVHGEVTITWPYSAVTKSFAFLLAEPDFRLRRDKGSVRIYLSGPSAEAVGKWELGSGDEVTLALDGVEWAKDEEPVRPAGSRIEWQLKFAGRLVLRATLGETSETKSINVDQPVPIEVAVPEAGEPIPLAEIDTTLFEDGPAVEERPLRTAAHNEFASPIFAKRSRASFGPLFELDLDDELEEDGGRRGKGRKRPRYSVQNRMWRYREDSSSPEPEASQDSPSPTRARNGDVEMEDTPAKPNMADGGCQTNESELAPHPLSSFHTPVKSWNMAGSSPSFGMGGPQPPDAARFDAGVQASPPGPVTSLPDEGHDNQVPQNTSNPFGLTTNSTGFPQVEGSAHPSFGIPQGPTPSTGQGFGHPSSLLGSSANSTNNELNQGLGQASSLFGAVPNRQSPQVLGHNSPLFGTGPAPTPSAFSQTANAGSGFGAGGGSLRFGFGQEPQSAFTTSPFTALQPSAHQPDPHPYPESYLNRDQTTDQALPVPQNPFGGITQDAEYQQSFVTYDRHEHPNSNRALEESSSWPMDSQTFDVRHASGRQSGDEDVRSDGSDPQSTPPGMVPPQVDDGTRNADEMQRHGLLSRPVYRQSVPQGALAGGEDVSVSEDFVDSDDQAYDEAEKGDDYDLRNYDRISDDEEGFDEQRPLPDDELMDEDEESLEGEEEDFDEDDYDEEDYEEEEHYSQTPCRPAQLPPQPQMQKEPIVIDLLSDSDDDEPTPVMKAPRSQTQQQQLGDFVQTESEKDVGGHLNESSGPYTAPPQQHEDVRSQRDEEDEEDFPEQVPGHVDDGTDNSFNQNEDVSGDFEGSGEEYVEPEDHELEDHEPEEEGSLVRNSSTAIGTVNSVTEVKEITTITSERTRGQVESDSEVIIEEVHAEIVAVEKKNVIHQENDGIDDAMELDEEHHDDLYGSFQTQPAEMLASFQSHNTAQTNPASSPTSHDAAHENIKDDLVHEEARTEANKEDLYHAPRSDAAEESFENDLTSKPPEEVIETFDEDSDEIGDDEIGESEKMKAHRTERLGDLGEQGDMPEDFHENVDDETGEAASIEDSRIKQRGGSGEQGNVPPSPPESQDQDVDMEPKVNNISMTTVASHVETQLSYERQIESRTQETDSNSMQAAGNDADQMDILQEKDTEMVDAGTLVKPDSSPEQVDDAQLAPGEDGQDKNDALQEPGTPEPAPDPKTNDTVSTPSPPMKKGPVGDDLVAEKRQSTLTQIDGTHENEDEQLQSTQDIPEVAKSSPIATQDTDASFATAASQVSETPDAEEAEVASTEKPKRGGRKVRLASSSKSAKSATVSKRGQRQTSSQQTPSIQRTTRSKTMSFQKSASPREDKEDMSIQLARAALKSPSAKTKRKVSATTAKRLSADLIKRLENDMPDCVALKDLRRYNSQTLDVAAVVTSAHTPPKRTVTREYASSFTITDPSLAPDGVVEVDLYSLHRDHLPVVKMGDAVLLRAFTVVSLPGRGFGLKTDKDESSWAVFEADAEDEPQMRAAPVEMNDRETKFLLELRAWHAGLDDGAREKLGKAVGEAIESGREERAKK